MLMQTHYPHVRRSGADGAYYFFWSNTGSVEMTGAIWSPEPEAKPGMLVGITYDMVGYCDGRSMKQLTKLSSDVAALEAKLKQ